MVDMYFNTETGGGNINYNYNYNRSTVVHWYYRFYEAKLPLQSGQQLLQLLLLPKLGLVQTVVLELSSLRMKRAALMLLLTTKAMFLHLNSLLMQ